MAQLAAISGLTWRWAAPRLVAFQISVPRLPQDPVNQRIALGVAVASGLVILYVLLKGMRWAAARANALIGVAVVVAGLFYGAVYLLHLGPQGWFVAGAIAFAMFLAVALWMTHQR